MSTDERQRGHDTVSQSRGVQVPPLNEPLCPSAQPSQLHWSSLFGTSSVASCTDFLQPTESGPLLDFAGDLSFPISTEATAGENIGFCIGVSNSLRPISNAGSFHHSPGLFEQHPFDCGAQIHFDSLLNPAITDDINLYKNGAPQETGPAQTFPPRGSALDMRRGRTCPTSAPNPTNSQRKGKQTVRCNQPDCSATFGRPAEFRRHLRTKHREPETENYRCLFESCKYDYPRADKVRSHMEKVHGWGKLF